MHGVVKERPEPEAPSYSTTLKVISGYNVEAECSCSSAEEMQEQWCAHAVALFWRSHDLGFFESESGFDTKESTFRVANTSPAEIANVITELSTATLVVAPEERFYPEVSIALDLSTDRLGVQVLFNGECQTPTLFEGFTRRSDRALDNLLLKALEEDGVWDETHQRWFMNSSKGIELALGIVQEYSKVFATRDSEPVKFSPVPLEACLDIKWEETSAELEMQWVLPNGSIIPKESELVGTGPFWTMVNHTIYRLSANAARIGALFPHSSTLTLSRTQLAPVLEALASASLVSQSRYVRTLNPELQPVTEIKLPSPVLHLEKKDDTTEHFNSRHELELTGTLEFQYPSPPSDKNVVFLPDREKELELSDWLRSLGFQVTNGKRSVTVKGEDALELLYEGPSLFKDPWTVVGLDAIKKTVKFSELSLNVNLASTRQKEEKGIKRSAHDWFDCHISLIQNNANIPISTLFKSGRSEGDRWVYLDNGSYARAPGGSLHQLKTTLGMLDPNFKLSNSIKASLTAAQAISLSRSSDDHVKVSLDQKLRDLSKKLEDFETIEQIPVSPLFIGELRSYQKEGVSWLYFLNQLGLGGILADEMGLGKTVQTLALLQYLKDKKKKGKTKPTLVIAPTSVITNWCYEAKRFAPQLSVLLLHGTARKARFQEISDFDIVVTSYALLRMDRYDLEKHDFQYIILDEAQNIKNPDAATTKSAKALRSDHRLCLTGTPTENRPQELWSILDFLMPGYLGSLDFFRTYVEKPILERGPDVHTAKFLNTKTRPFILRRKKHDVEKDLPPKVESVLHVDMADSQRQLYNAILEEVRPQIFNQVEERGVRGASISILAALLRLRQVCNHPNSIESLKELPGYDSGKFNLMKDLVTEALENNRKILLFSQFREMLYLIRKWLFESGVNHLYLDGATKNRQEIVDRFNNDSDVRLFLISLKAGGTGLNLTAADTVIIYDPWWNPAVESQAVDRAHRIGQAKTVSVYRLVTENSVEQKIMDLKAKKSKIAEALINSEEALSVMKLSRSDLESIFSPIPTE